MIAFPTANLLAWWHHTQSRQVRECLVLTSIAAFILIVFIHFTISLNNVWTLFTDLVSIEFYAYMMMFVSAQYMIVWHSVRAASVECQTRSPFGRLVYALLHTLQGHLVYQVACVCTLAALLNLSHSSHSLLHLLSFEGEVGQRLVVHTTSLYTLSGASIAAFLTSFIIHFNQQSLLHFPNLQLGKWPRIRASLSTFIVDATMMAVCVSVVWFLVFPVLVRTAGHTLVSVVAAGEEIPRRLIDTLNQWKYEPTRDDIVAATAAAASTSSAAATAPPTSIIDPRSYDEMYSVVDPSVADMCRLIVLIWLCHFMWRVCRCIVHTVLTSRLEFPDSRLATDLIVHTNVPMYARYQAYRYLLHMAEVPSMVANCYLNVHLARARTTAVHMPTWDECSAQMRVIRQLFGDTTVAVKQQRTYRPYAANDAVFGSNGIGVSNNNNVGGGGLRYRSSFSNSNDNYRHRLDNGNDSSNINNNSDDGLVSSAYRMSACNHFLQVYCGFRPGSYDHSMTLKPHRRRRHHTNNSNTSNRNKPELLSTSSPSPLVNNLSTSSSSLLHTRPSAASANTLKTPWLRVLERSVSDLEQLARSLYTAPIKVTDDSWWTWAWSLNAQAQTCHLLRHVQMYECMIQALSMLVTVASVEDHRGVVQTTLQPLMCAYLALTLALEHHIQSPQFVSTKQRLALQGHQLMRVECLALGATLDNAIYRLVTVFYEQLEQLAFPSEYARRLQHYVDFRI